MARYTPFIPRRDAEMVNWSRNFSARLLADPAGCGVTPGAAAHYALLHADLEAAYARASAPETRTRAAVVEKDRRRDLAEAEARRLARLIKAGEAANPGTLADLGLGAGPATGGGTPIGAPASAPRVAIESVRGRTLRVRLRDAGSMSRAARPAGAIGAVIFTHAGEGEPPAGLAQWQYAGHTSRNVCAVTLAEEAGPGTRVWVTACWLSPTLRSGPPAPPACDRVGWATEDARPGTAGVRAEPRAA